MIPSLGLLFLLTSSLSSDILAIPVISKAALHSVEALHAPVSQQQHQQQQHQPHSNGNTNNHENGHAHAPSTETNDGKQPSTPPDDLEAPKALVIPYETNRKIVMVKGRNTKKDKGWEFPRGKAHVGEKHLQTAVRELREETGLPGVQHHNKEVVNLKDNSGKDLKAIALKVDPEGKKVPVAPEEQRQVQIVRKKDVHKMIQREDMQKAWKIFRKGTKYPGPKERKKQPTKKELRASKGKAGGGEVVSSKGKGKENDNDHAEKHGKEWGHEHETEPLLSNANKAINSAPAAAAS